MNGYGKKCFIHSLIYGAKVYLPLLTNLSIMFKFEKLSKNEVVNVDENTYISYNANPWWNVFSFRSDDDWAETALVVVVDWIRNFFIKNWDLRKEIRKCKNRDDVINVFLNSKLKTSSRTTS